MIMLAILIILLILGYGNYVRLLVCLIIGLLLLSTCSIVDVRAEGTIRFVTAYNVGDPKQCDDTPCIAANNKNICNALERGEQHCAANFVPLGTKLHIDKVGTCVVSDRMNRRYKNRVDIAMKLTEVPKARAFGKQKLYVEVLK